MPTITSIKPQKSKKRVNIYLDGKFGFGLDLENFVKLNLKVEQELTEKEIKRIVKDAEYAKTKDKLLKFVNTRPRSEKEVKDWFKRKKVHTSIYKKLISFLKRYDYLDDEKFAAWWVEQRNTFRPKSKRMLMQELRLKGIGKHLIDDTLAKFNIDEDKVAGNLVKKNMHKWKKYEGFEKRQKMSSFLARKGFSWSVIKKVVRVDD